MKKQQSKLDKVKQRVERKKSVIKRTRYGVIKDGKLVEFKVYTRSWFRGGSPHNSFLYNAETKKKCCVGFACLAADIPVKNIADQIRADLLVLDTKNRDNLGALTSTPHSGEISCVEMSRIYRTNDDPTITDAERVEILRNSFLSLGVKVRFIGKLRKTVKKKKNR